MKTKFAQRLKELRKENNISQKQLSKAIGYSQPIISQWESEVYEPTASAIVVVAEYFNVCTDYLLGRKDIY
ncbi:MAG: helix-turn-helix transcriptional regulator [Clostridia bacterium]|nr:helix-turn-helix transcriptional regulator [Clostridia bacterium]